MATLFTKYSNWVVDGSVQARFKLLCTYTQNSSALSSNITETLYLEISGSGQARATDIALTGTGVNLSVLSIPFKTSTYQIGSASKTIWHKAKNGTASFTSAVSGTIVVNGGSGTYETVTIPSFTATLPTLDVYNDLTFNTTTPIMSDTLSITIAKASASATTSVKATINGNDTQIYSGSGTSATYTIPSVSDLISLCVSTDYVPITITSIAYNSSNTQLGTKTYTINAYLPSTIKPNVSASISNSIANVTPFIIGRSQPIITLTADMSADEGATISGYAYVLRDGSATGQIIDSGSIQTSANSYTFNANASLISDTTYVLYSVVDSRGRTTTNTTTISAITYNQPTLNVSAERCNSSGVAESTGAYLLLTYNWSVQDVNSQNLITEPIKFYLSTDGTTYTEYSSAQFTPSALSGNTTLSYYPPLAVTTNGYMYVTIADTIGGVVSSNIVQVSKSVIAFGLYDDGNGNVGASFGKVPNSAGTEIVNAKSITTSDSKASLFSKVIFEGTILGSSSASVDCSGYDYIECLILDYSASFIVTVDLTYSNWNNFNQSAWTSTHVYRGTNASTLYVSATSVENHFAHVGVNSAKNVVYLTAIGYYASFTNLKLRNSNSAYAIKKITGFKRLS